MKEDLCPQMTPMNADESETNKGENLNRVPCSRLASMNCRGPWGGR